MKAAKALQLGVLGLISIISLGVNVQAGPPLLDLAAEFEQLNSGKSAQPVQPINVRPVLKSWSEPVYQENPAYQYQR